MQTILKCLARGTSRLGLGKKRKKEVAFVPDSSLPRQKAREGVIAATGDARHLKEMGISTSLSMTVHLDLKRTPCSKDNSAGTYPTLRQTLFLSLRLIYSPLFPGPCEPTVNRTSRPY